MTEEELDLLLDIITSCALAVSDPNGPGYQTENARQAEVILRALIRSKQNDLK